MWQRALLLLLPLRLAATLLRPAACRLSWDAKMARQCEPGYTCCLCAMSCCSYGGLQSHLLACHQYLSYDFLLPDGQLPPAAALGLVQSELSGVVVVRVPLSCFDRHTGRLLGRLERTYSAVEGQAVVNMFNTFVFHRSLKAPLDFPTGAAQMLHRIEPLPLPLPLPLQLPPLPLKALGTLALDARGERGGKQGGRGRGARGARGRGGAGTGSGRGSGLISAGSGAPEGISLDCRSYYHSRTAVPMPRQEAIGGVDTDDETDDDEYERSFKRDERDKRVTTASERRLMLMWNSFARAHPVFSDFVVKSRCIKFVEVNLTELRSLPSLRRGLLSFLMMLWDCALVESGTIDACIRLYDGTSVPQQEALQAAAAGQLTGGVGAGSGEGASGSGVSRGGGAGAAAQPQAVGA
ncbi:hypothetical protein FOA52_000925 [Chlamydomonas sp. UWO 241]|nr:hypothetical protein FOA52_000925 [Chlamydomonas sp. UWO 241]